MIKVFKQVARQPYEHVLYTLWCMDKDFPQVQNQIKNQIGTQLWNQVGTQVRNQIWAQTGNDK